MYGIVEEDCVYHKDIFDREYIYSKHFRYKDKLIKFEIYFPDGKLEYQAFYKDDFLHKLDGPAQIIFNKNGSIKESKYYIDGERYFCKNNEEFKQICKLLILK